VTYLQPQYSQNGLGVLATTMSAFLHRRGIWRQPRYGAEGRKVEGYYSPIVHGD
jgi:hypothetical protein